MVHGGYGILQLANRGQNASGQPEAQRKHYYETYVKRMECYGAPLDADKAVDSEGILAYIKAVRYLHALTGDDLYLDHMGIQLITNSPLNLLTTHRLRYLR